MKKEKISFSRAHNSASKDPHKSAISSEEIKWGQWQETHSLAFSLTFIQTQPLSIIIDQIQDHRLYVNKIQLKLKMLMK